MTRRRASLWIPPTLLMALIYYSSSQPDPAPMLTENFWDKGLHFMGYGALAFLFSRAFRGERFAIVASLVWAFLASSAYGATDEWHQMFTVERTASMLDLLADVTGSALGAALFGAVDYWWGLTWRPADGRQA